MSSGRGAVYRGGLDGRCYVDGERGRHFLGDEVEVGDRGIETQKAGRSSWSCRS